MPFFKLGPLEYMTTSGKGATSIYVNLDNVVFIKEDASTGSGHFVLTGGTTYFLDHDAFERLVKAIDLK